MGDRRSATAAGCRRSGFRRGLLLLALVLVGFTLGPREAHAAVPPSGSGLSMWGASFQSPAPWEWSGVRSFERMLGKSVSLVGFGSPFANCSARGCRYYGFPRGLMTKIRRRGAIPVISWGSSADESALVEPAFDLAAVAGGRYDHYIRKFARAARRWGHPFMIRFDWEMNGNWFPWGQHVNGNDAAGFVAAWRHVHDIFTAAHADNVSWVWCPNVGNWFDLRKLYPGSAYVDWACLDGYNWGTTGQGSAGAQRGGWQSFTKIFGAAYRNITRRIAPGKPVLLGEVASSPDGGDEAAWISNMFSLLPWRYPQIRALMWYQVQDAYDFPLRPGTAAAGAFAAGIRNSLYAPNVFCRLRGPIAPITLSGAVSYCGAG